MESAIHVVAGIVRDAHGRVLLAQRPAGKHLAGLWEFPGGKSESDEAGVDALARELREEIGITVESARPLIAVPHRYPEKDIVLDVWQVLAYSGVPHAREGQPLAWVEIADLDRMAMPQADRPVASALRLPDRYLITPPLPVEQTETLLRGIESACRKGLRMIQLRLPHWSRDDIATLARAARNSCHQHDARLLLNDDWRLAQVLGLDGVHLPARTAATLQHRPLGRDRWVGVSCHDATELAQAARIGADFATLSPVYETPAHPHTAPLGWERFGELTAQATLPVFALGGLDEEDLDAAQMSGAQGIAAVRAWWARAGLHSP